MVDKRCGEISVKANDVPIDDVEFIPASDIEIGIGQDADDQCTDKAREVQVLHDRTMCKLRILLVTVVIFPALMQFVAGGA